MHTPLCQHARGLPQEYAAVAEKRGLKGPSCYDLGTLQYRCVVSFLEGALNTTRQVKRRGVVCRVVVSWLLCGTLNTRRIQTFQNPYSL